MIRPAPRSLGCLLLVAASLACRPTAPPLRLTARWIDDTTVATSESAAAIYQREEVIGWRFDQTQDLAGWRTVDLDLSYRINPGGGLLMRSSKADPCLWRPVDLQAEDIDEIQIVRSPLTGGRVQLFWQGDEVTFTEENSATAWAADPGGNLVQTFTFRLQGLPRWRGRIRYLRFDLTEMPNHRVVLYAIRASRYRFDAGQVAAAVATPQRVDLGHREMLARLAPPGLPWAREVAISPGSRLHFAYGLEQRLGPKITFELRFEASPSPVGQVPPQAAPQARAEPLFTAVLDPATQGRAWQDASVDLSGLAGRQGRLVFETRTDPGYDPRRGFPVWGNPELASPGNGSPWNLVWIVVDTLRADRLSLYGYAKKTSPRLDAWAGDRGATFTNTIAAAPWTLPSHVSMFTGQSALRHGVNYKLPAPAAITLLPEHLRQHGYSTAAVTGGGYVVPAFGLSQGFDRFEYPSDADEHGWTHAAKDLPLTLAAASAFLDSQPAEPFFLFVHTYEVHSPYTAHEPYFSQLYGGPRPAGIEAITTEPVAPAADNGWQQESRFIVAGSGEGVHADAPEQKRLLDALYDSGVRATDEAIGTLLAQLARLQLDERSLIIVSSDHGESLGEHASAGHVNLYDVNLKVPLVIARPDGRGRGQKIATQVRLIDLAATITDSLGLPPLPRNEGQSLVPLLTNPQADFPPAAESLASSTNQGISLRIANRQKLIYQNSLWQPTQGRQELYQLDQDPAEQSDRSPGDSEGATRLTRQLAGRFAEATSNVLVEAHNRTADPLVFTLRGDVAHAFTAKGFAQPTGAFEWLGGEIQVRIPAHGDLRFFLDGHQQGELLASFFEPRSSQPLESLAQVLTIADLTAPATFRWQAGWRRDGSARLGGADSGVTFSWHGQRDRAPVAEPPPPDVELRRQLQALGYLH